MKSLIKSAMYMKMDVYEQLYTQDEATNAIIKKWLYVKTVNCLARGYISDSAKGQGSGEKVGERYQNVDYLTIETDEKITKSQKITNIRNQQDEVIWFDLVGNNYDTPTTFDVVGAIPVLDPFGSILSYNISVKRSEVQSFDEYNS